MTGCHRIQPKTVCPMNRIMLAAAVACTLAVPFETSPAAAQGSDKLRNANITFQYVVPRKPPDPDDAMFRKKMEEYEINIAVYERLRTRKVLELLSQFISPLNLPHMLALRTDVCGTENAFYSPPDAAFTICYEYVFGTERDAPRAGSPVDGTTRDDAIIGGFVDAALHELGHALFDIYNIPVLGREEDGADQIAAFVMLQFSKDVALTTIKGAAYSYKMLAERGSPAYWDEHGTPSQRFFNYLCIAYGSPHRDAFKPFVDAGLLPPARARNCNNEYAQVDKAFRRYVLPNINRELMRIVQETEWLPRSTGR
jgi:hypothetical protein